MFSFRRGKSARVSVRAALLAGATVAVVGFGATGTAAAAPSCTGSNIEGIGSSLQKVAQEKVWIPNFHTNICNFGTEPTVKYEPAGSGTGLKKWNSNTEEGKINTAYSFVGTDDAPSTSQMANIDSVAGGAHVLVVPVAQTSIAVIANPPSGCPIEEIANKDLERVFAGTIVKWSQLSSVIASPNPACNKKLKRVVRLDGSGQTYQFKNYLNLINKAKLPCIEETQEKTWAELETNGLGGKPNIVWPEDEGCAVPLSEVLRPPANGGGEVAKKVIQTSGSIAYASLPDAESKIAVCKKEEGEGKAGACGNTEVLKVQNNGKVKLEEATYVSPRSGEQANCSTAQYKVPTNAQPAKTHTALDADWSLVFGAKINTTKTGGGYPICTLTFALALNDYSSAGFTEGQATTAKDYLTEYITASAGQTDIAAQFYNSLPTSGVAGFNVLSSAQFTASKIGF